MQTFCDSKYSTFSLIISSWMLVTSFTVNVSFKSVAIIWNSIPMEHSLSFRSRAKLKFPSPLNHKIKIWKSGEHENLPNKIIRHLTVIFWKGKQIASCIFVYFVPLWMLMFWLLRCATFNFIKILRKSIFETIPGRCLAFFLCMQESIPRGWRLFRVRATWVYPGSKLTCVNSFLVEQFFLDLQTVITVNNINLFQNEYER